MAKFRKIGFVFQFHNLLPEFTLFENVCLPCYLGNFHKKEVDQKSGAILTLLGLHHLNRRFPADVPKGELQRIAVARRRRERQVSQLRDMGNLICKTWTTRSTIRNRSGHSIAEASKTFRWP